MNNVDVTFERYDVSASYTCPFCGEKRSFTPSASDIGYMVECGCDVVCGKCGNHMLLWCDWKVGDAS